MCSIIIATTTERALELIELNEYRGTHSHSYTLFGENQYGDYEIFHQEKDFGPIDKSKVKIPGSCFAVIHQQAPTTDNRDLSSIHPAQLGEHYLWHNGIIKEDCVKRMQKDLESTFDWDTKLILRQYIERDNLDGIDGSFACVFAYKTKLYVFRNEISPLFTTEGDWDVFSSTKFDGAVPLAPNVVYSLEYNKFDECFDAWPYKEFKTVDNPYYFGE